MEGTPNDFDKYACQAQQLHRPFPRVKGWTLATPSSHQYHSVSILIGIEISWQQSLDTTHSHDQDKPLRTRLAIHYTAALSAWNLDLRRLPMLTSSPAPCAEERTRNVLWIEKRVE